MQTFISMLRGINVSGKNRISMADLKALYESLGLANVVTYVQSGNVVFDGENISAAAIESEIKRTLGLDVPVLLRDKNCFERLLKNNPFAVQRHEDPALLHVTFLAATPAPSALLVTPNGCTDEFVLEDRELYLFCPGGYGVTKLSNSFFERKLKMVATTRNWKTVNALYEITSQRNY